MGVRPKVGLPAVYLGDLGGRRRFKTANGTEKRGQGRPSVGNPLSSTRLEGSGRAGREGGRCWRHLESSIFLFLPNFVGAEFADG